MKFLALNSDEISLKLTFIITATICSIMSVPKTLVALPYSAFEISSWFAKAFKSILTRSLLTACMIFLYGFIMLSTVVYNVLVYFYKSMKTFYLDQKMHFLNLLSSRRLWMTSRFRYTSFFLLNIVITTVTIIHNIMVHTCSILGSYVLKERDYALLRRNIAENSKISLRRRGYICGRKKHYVQSIPAGCEIQNYRRNFGNCRTLLSSVNTKRIALNCKSMKIELSEKCKHNLNSKLQRKILRLKNDEANLNKKQRKLFSSPEVSSNNSTFRPWAIKGNIKCEQLLKAKRSLQSKRVLNLPRQSCSLSTRVDSLDLNKEPNQIHNTASKRNSAKVVHCNNSPTINFKTKYITNECNEGKKFHGTKFDKGLQLCNGSKNVLQLFRRHKLISEDSFSDNDFNVDNLNSSLRDEINIFNPYIISEAGKVLPGKSNDKSSNSREYDEFIEAISSDDLDESLTVFEVDESSVPERNDTLTSQIRVHSMTPAVENDKEIFYNKEKTFPANQQKFPLFRNEMSNYSEQSHIEEYPDLITNNSFMTQTAGKDLCNGSDVRNSDKIFDAVTDWPVEETGEIIELVNEEGIPFIAFCMTENGRIRHGITATENIPDSETEIKIGALMSKRKCDICKSVLEINEDSHSAKVAANFKNCFGDEIKTMVHGKIPFKLDCPICPANKLVLKANDSNWLSYKSSDFESEIAESENKRPLERINCTNEVSSSTASKTPEEQENFKIDSYVNKKMHFNNEMTTGKNRENAVNETRKSKENSNDFQNSNISQTSEFLEKVLGAIIANHGITESKYPISGLCKIGLEGPATNFQIDNFIPIAILDTGSENRSKFTRTASSDEENKLLEKEFNSDLIKCDSELISEGKSSIAFSENYKKSYLPIITPSGSKRTSNSHFHIDKGISATKLDSGSENEVHIVMTTSKDAEEAKLLETLCHTSSIKIDSVMTDDALNSVNCMPEDEKLSVQNEKELVAECHEKTIPTDENASPKLKELNGNAQNNPEGKINLDEQKASIKPRKNRKRKRKNKC